ncbi:hypothetical protein [Aldersonia kunmingensis]|uniref:hypothetical protein n=1 Tax=Aldersonia kunmingensis TaxID=408066 RepID=UPI000835D446|nr:hypothetical protein [Aldersonia kunmingensis]
MSTPDAAAPLSADERAELELLRKRVADLEGAEAPSAPASERHRGNTLRWIAAGVLIVLVAVLVVGGVAARFARSQILDTDRYVETVAPLAKDPAIQADITNQITQQIFTRLDIEAATKDALTALTENAPRVPTQVVGLAPVIAGQAEGFIRDTVNKLVTSDEFANLWVDANRIAHENVVAVLTGNTKRVKIDENGTVSIPLGPIIDKVKQRLDDRGFAFADKIPQVDASYTLFQSKDIVKAQRLTRLLDRLATWLPWIAVALAVGAIFTAPRGGRLRAMALVGLAVAIAMVLLGFGLNAARAYYLDDIPTDVLTPAAAGAITDIVTVPLKLMIRATFAVAVVIALVGFLLGGSRSAHAVRHGYSRALDALRRSGSGREPNQFETWVAQLRVPLRIAIIAIAVAILIFWRYPTGLVVLTVAVLAVIALIVVEILARPAVNAARAIETSTPA